MVLLLCGAIGLLVGTLGMWIWVGRTGESQLESWVGSELRRSVAASGRFTLDFDLLDYQSPDRLVVENLQLIRSGADKPMVQVDRAQIILDRVPRRGEPVVLREVDLQQPVVRIDAIIGQRETTTRSTTRPNLSSIVTLKRVGIRQGQMLYDDRHGESLSWTDLNADLTLEASDEAWHTIKLSVDQSPLIKIDASGAIHLDRLACKDVILKGKLDLSDRQAVRFFTTPVQRWLERHELRGVCTIDVQGNASLTQPSENALEATFSLADGNMAAGNYRFPIEKLTAKGGIRGTQVVLDELEAVALDGAALADATMSLDSERAVRGQLLIRKMRLEAMVKRVNPDEPHALAGTLDATIDLRSTVADLRQLRQPGGEQIKWGSGTISVRDGRLIQLPIIGDVFAATRQVASLVTGAEKFADKLDMEFDFVGRRFVCRDLLYVGDVMAMRGRGEIGFRGAIDLQLNAGPLERLQQLLGPIGDLWGKITDSVMTYHVTGTLKSPEVQPMLGPGK